MKLRKPFRILRNLILFFFISSIGAVIFYRFVPVYVTPLMIIRSVKQLVSGEKVVCKHTWVPFDKISPSLPMAVIASEEARTLDFYVNKLGFTVESQVWRPEQRDYLRMLRLGNLVLELFIKPDAPARLTLPEALGLRHLAFRVTNIQAARDWLNAQGIETEPIHEDKANGGHYVFFRDPDGLPLELHD